jgi:hypothetical protein
VIVSFQKSSQSEAEDDAQLLAFESGKWFSLIERSDIYETFEHQGLEFQLTQTDRKYNAMIDQYEEKVR